MEKTVEKLRGWAEATVVGPSPETFLNLCARRGIVLSQCRAVNEAELRCVIPRRYISGAKECAEKAQCQIKIRHYRGASYTVGKVKRRYVLLAGLLAVLMILGVSGMYIWDIDVEGNENVSRAEILNALEDCGVYIGANWTAFNADLIRSHALAALPGLSFLTVNVHGSRATVIVRERIEVPELVYDTEKCDIVASKSGVILSMNVFRGNPIVSKGGAVLQGDVLISSSVPGVERWGETTKYNSVSALGEVWAQTSYEFSASDSLQINQKEYTGRKAKNYALVLGGNRINIYYNTGIYRDECDTIYDTWTLEVKGLFTLPVSVVRETRAQYELSAGMQNAGMVEARLKQELTDRLLHEIGEDGLVLSQDFVTSEDEGVVTVKLTAACKENIALKQAVSP